MSLLFYGAILNFLDFNLNIGTVSIDVLPDFIGWFLVVKGIDKLLEENPYLGRIDRQNARTLAFVMAIVTTVIFCLNLIGIWAYLGIIATCLDFVVFVGYFLCWWKIVDIISAIQATVGEIGAANLQTAMIAMLVANGCSILVPILLPSGIFIIAVVIACFVIAIWFLYTLNQVRRNYESLTGGMQWKE